MKTKLISAACSFGLVLALTARAEAQFGLVPRVEEAIAACDRMEHDIRDQEDRIPHLSMWAQAFNVYPLVEWDIWDARVALYGETLPDGSYSDCASRHLSRARSAAYGAQLNLLRAIGDGINPPPPDDQAAYIATALLRVQEAEHQLYWAGVFVCDADYKLDQVESFLSGL